MGVLLEPFWDPQRGSRVHLGTIGQMGLLKVIRVHGGTLEVRLGTIGGPLGNLFSN